MNKMIPVEKWGYSLPITAPLYKEPPEIWYGARVQCVVYETKEERVREVVPEPLEPVNNTVIAWVSDNPLTNVGPFHEAAVYVTCKFKKIVAVYEPFLYVDQEVPFANGREIWGYCKKLANISLRLEKEIVIGEVERVGTKIMTLLSTNDKPAKLEDIPWTEDGIFSIKYIPSAEAGKPPLRQLILTKADLKARPGAFFGGVGSIRFERSEIDPLYRLEPVKIIGGFYGICDMNLPLGKIVHNY